ncbi:MAG: YARHG domain-containing protein [Pseudobutyrivibrio sp.]|nr:YARHG domain-containing protein [Pseudobutyrivibrio sp.]
MTRQEREERLEKRRRIRVRRAKRIAAELAICISIGIVAGILTYIILDGRGDAAKALTPADDAKIEEVVESEIEEEKGNPDVVDALEKEGNEPEEEDEDKTKTIDKSSYVESIRSWSDEEITAAISERKGYLSQTKYYSQVSSYLASKGISEEDGQCIYLFDTARTLYTAEDFQGISPDVIRIIKNEIYARHGYSFRDPDLYNYFMGQIWYSPSVLAEDFSEEIFSETEVKNLDLINAL